MPVSTQFHSSMGSQKSAGRSPMVRTPSPKPSPMAAGAPSEVTEAAYSRWKVELTNKLVVEHEKAQHAERQKYKAHEDGKFWERKQNLHKKTADQFGKAKMEVEAVRQGNLTRWAEYKAELEEMKEMAAQQREEWMQFGHELTVQHGPEQAERTKARLAETAEAKAELGRQVKQESQLNSKQRHQQRTNRLEEKRELVDSTKQREYSTAEESKNFSFHQKEEKVPLWPDPWPHRLPFGKLASHFLALSTPRPPALPGAPRLTLPCSPPLAPTSLSFTLLFVPLFF
jgi:hypothetical protein